MTGRGGRHTLTPPPAPSSVEGVLYNSGPGPPLKQRKDNRIENF